MTFSTSSNTYLLVAAIMSLALRIFLIILTILIALGLGLLFRRLLIRRLQKTVLDKWVVQTLGVVIVFPPLILAALAAPLIWDPSLIVAYWDSIKSQVKITDLITLALHLVETLLLIGLGVGVARTARTLAIRGLGENRIDINIRTLIGRIFYFIILIFVIFWIPAIWQISVGVPVTVIGILTVAITVAVQDILKDLVAGFYILIERPFRIGDQISTSTPAAYTGKVEDIQLRATKLRLVSGEELIIPNSLIFGNTVVNNTYYYERRATITITVPEEEFVKEETAEQLLKAISAIEGVLAKPEPTVKLTGYTEKNALLTARFWIADGQLSTVSDVMYALHTALPHAELTVRESGGDV
jgi:small-conductance mechanosensitive channel